MSVLNLSFFTDTLFEWLNGLNALLSILDFNLISTVRDFFDNGDSVISSVAGDFIVSILQFFGFQDISILGFILSMMGTGFVFYLVFTIVKWGLDLLP